MSDPSPPPPVVELQYASHGAHALLPPRPETLPMLQDAADAYCGRRFLREQSLLGIIAAAALVAILLWGGLERADAPLLAVCAAMAVAHVVTLLRPLPVMMLVHGAIVVAFYGVIMLPSIASTFRGDVLDLAGVGLTATWAVVVLFMMLPTLRHYRRYRRVQMVAPTPDVAAWLESCVQRLSSDDADRDLGLVRLRAFAPTTFSEAVGLLSGDVSLWLLDRRHLQFVSREEFEMEARRPVTRNVRVRVHLRLGPGARLVRATMSAEHFARYERWRQTTIAPYVLP